MKAIFNIKGSIEIDLPEEIIEKFNEQRLEAGKKHVLEEYFHDTLWGCSLAGKRELGYYIDFGLNICHSTYEIFYKYGDDIKMPYNIDEEVK